MVIICHKNTFIGSENAIQRIDFLHIFASSFPYSFYFSFLFCKFGTLKIVYYGKHEAAIAHCGRG